jgi:adenylate cyclase
MERTREGPSPSYQLRTQAGRTLLPLLPASLLSHLGLSRSESHLPQRIRAVVVANEEQSERLIGWTQLALASIFLMLFCFSPSPPDAMPFALEPVLLVIATYFLFTVVRLVVSYRSYLPGWLLVLSMLADTALLFGVIWLFQFRYGQSAAFVVKVPTFTYIFIFIALRALRFDHRFVLSAGVFGIVGWIILVLAAIYASPPETITRSFVEYLTTNRILLGAEFDKIITITLVTMILSLAVWRGRQILLTAVGEEASARSMRRFFAADVANVITSVEHDIEAGAAVERYAAIIMLDIRGFTRFSARVTPQHVVSILTSLHRRVLPIAAAHGGVVDKFLGDGIMITFGAVKETPRPAGDAMRALVEIMQAASAWSAELSPVEAESRLVVNGAAAAGTVVFAAIGYEDRLEYTVIGEAVNLAAKLEKHNKSERTRALVPVDMLRRAVLEGYQQSQPLIVREGRNVAGVDAPMDIVVVVDEV